MKKNNNNSFFKDRMSKIVGKPIARWAQEAGFLPETVRKWCIGKTMPGTDATIKILEQNPDLSPDWLLLGKGQEKRTNDQGNTQAFNEHTIDHFYCLEWLVSKANRAAEADDIDMLMYEIESILDCLNKMKEDRLSKKKKTRASEYDGKVYNFVSLKTVSALKK